MRVLVTRPVLDAQKWVKDLASAGFDAYALPLIEVRAAMDEAPVHKAWKRLAEFDAVMFVSGNAVAYFFASKPTVAHMFTVQSATKTRAFVPGPGSYHALMQQGVAAECVDVPALEVGQFDSEALWAVVKGQVKTGFRLLIVRGSGEHGAAAGDGVGRDWFADQARRQGAWVEFVVAYQRVAPQLNEAQKALALAASHDGSVWLFSSSEAIANLGISLPGHDWSRGRAVATHPRIARAARELGFDVVCESRPLLVDIRASIESLR
ncbi:uroporphyrinogen-III synthase [Rhodoferax aquaticus]|uniref:Uroporphyrinogen-III synthase n=1 Tax=Rhodoferax aquaticus TaxID=2527691 RepID=A0A515ERZ7_9BURK|nr:uroporphyrinogen-III synthase [Rhodoferax aquaticus]QDL55442.1 uroporphyrinogen-III synthase [Rhodoferax aquaticus]